MSSSKTTGTITTMGQSIKAGEFVEIEITPRDQFLNELVMTEQLLN